MASCSNHMFQGDAVVVDLLDQPMSLALSSLFAVWKWWRTARLEFRIASVVELVVLAKDVRVYFDAGGPGGVVAVGCLCSVRFGIGSYSISRYRRHRSGVFLEPRVGQLVLP